MDAGDDSAGVIERSGLLHVEVIGNGEVSPLAVLLLPEELSVDDDGETWLWHHLEQLILEAVNLTKGPSLG